MAQPPNPGGGSQLGPARRQLLVSVLAITVIAIVLLSDVPTSALPLGKDLRPGPAAVQAQTAQPRGTTNPAESAPPLLTCAKDGDPACPGVPATASPGSSPDLSTPSSWTNITPRSGSPNPPNRFLPAMTYYPGGHEVVLFGGYGAYQGGPFTFYQDTWTFVDNAWSLQIPNASCTASSCPSPRAGAMVTYYPPDNAVLLFGGYAFSPSISYVAFNDTWLYEGDTWHNITASAGAPPSPRFQGSMVWDALDDYALLFGGELESGTSLGDTWSFNGTWHNLTGHVGSAPPTRRDSAAITNSPSGWIMLFGGETDGVLITDVGGCGSSVVGWWFYDGAWVEMPMSPVCIFGPAAHASINGTYPPCGRIDAALGWSPQNNRFVLYGGIGPEVESNCTGFHGFLNDTWSYANPPGTGFNWGNATDSGDPPARYEMGYANDFTDRYFEVFGGWDGRDGGRADTWRFAELVHAKLSGPSNIDTSGAPSFLLPFEPVGYGGSGNLDYWFSLRGIKNGNALSGSGCANLTDGLNSTLPYDGTDQVTCHATPTSYNVYRLTVHVWDVNNSSDRASANWTFLVSPPETFAIYSQYSGVFYSGVNFPDNLAFLAAVASAPATTVSFTLDGVTYYPTQRSGHPDWWDLSLNIKDLSPGPQVVQATGDFAENWTLNASYTLDVIQTPVWLSDIIVFPSVNQTITPSGAGPYNQSYSISEQWNWSLDSALSFALPIPLATGNYSLVPAIHATITATSAGDVSLTGSLSLTPPKISLGPVDLQLSAAISLTGTFDISTTNGDIQGITWISAVASISVLGKVSASVPIYGFSILGVSIGFTLEVEVDPSITLGMVLAPTTPGFDEFIPGIAIKIQQFVGSFSLPLSLAVKFSIGVASVELGGSIGIALQFATNTGLSVVAGWVNGTIFAQASFLCWSVQWNILSGTIYSWTDPPVAPALRPGSLLPSFGYNNGTGAIWALHARYYAGPGYDARVWAANGSAGPAVSDIYPYTAVTGAAGANGDYLFFTDDDSVLPVQSGLTVSGLGLNASTNELTSLPSPSDPGFVLASPRATTLPNGSLYVVWDALPSSETSLASPTQITRLELHGAVYDPVRRVWGPTRAYTSWGLAQSYALDATGSSPELTALVSTSALVGATTPERLEVFHLGSSTPTSNTSVVGLARLVSLRASAGLEIAQQAGGNFTVLDPVTGGSVPIGYSSPIGGELVSADFVTGSPSTMVLLYRGATGSLLVLYDPALGRAEATLGVGEDALDAQALVGSGTTFVFARTSAGIEGWSETGGTFTNLSSLSEPGVESYAAVQLGGSILVYALLAHGNATEPIVTLEFAEVGAQLPPLSFAPSTSSGSSISRAILYLAIEGAAVGVLLAVVAVLTRPGRSRSTPPKPPASLVNPPDAPGGASPSSSDANPGGGRAG